LSQNLYELLSKREKNIKKQQISHNLSYLFIHHIYQFRMDEEKNWMLMTYYCPTHGDTGIVKPIEITKRELSKKFLKKDKNS